MISSEKVLFLVCEKPFVEITTDFLLVNKAKVPATYQFDIPRGPNIFECHPSHGVIGSVDCLHVVVKFLPKKRRIYFKEVACLVEHQVRDVKYVSNYLVFIRDYGFSEFAKLLESKWWYMVWYVWVCNYL